MVQMTIEMPESALAALRKTPEDFARELRLAAAAKWYELRQLSQERVANASPVIVLAKVGRLDLPVGMSIILDGEFWHDKYAKFCRTATRRSN